MKKSHLIVPVVIASALALVGCGGGREVEVSGEAKSAETVAGPISLQFFEVPAAGEDAATEAIKTAELPKLGAFKETVEVEGDSVRILALVDTDKDGKCTEGELWGEATAAISADDTVAAVAIELKAQACPKPAATDTAK